MCHKKNTLIISLLLTGSVALAQFDKLLNQARRYYDKGQLFEAKDCYKKILEKDSLSKIANLELAELLFFDIEDYEASYIHIRRYLQTQKDTSVSFIYALGKCEHFNGEPDKAQRHFERCREKLKDEEVNPSLPSDISRHLASIIYCRENALRKSERISVVNLGGHVNTQYPEYVPVVSEDENILMFTSTRKNTMNPRPGNNDDHYREDMYVAKKKGLNFESPNILPAADQETKLLKNSPRNESLISLSPDGKTLFLFKDRSIYSSEYRNGSWGDPKLLDKKIISKAYENHASVTADGMKIFLTSERKGGEGGLDIYYAEKQSNGAWSKPVNLGSEINTKDDEESPYITPDGKTLFFSSNGHTGYGEHDIYKSEWDGNKFGKPQNLGLPFNSVADDIFFYPHSDLSQGYIASNRKGGFGDFDIYRFYYVDRPTFKIRTNETTPPEFNTSLKKIEDDLVNASPETETVIAQFKTNPKVAGIYFKVNDSLVTEDIGVLKNELKRKEKNQLRMEVIFNCDTCIYRQSYTSAFSIPKEDFLVNNNVPAESGSTVLAGLVPVYFDYAKYQVRSSETEMLEKNISVLKKNPKRNFVIYGHADSRGSAELNKRLALQRAQRVKEYLISKGIDKTRIKMVISKGEEEPMINCGDSCTEEQHQQNRRVEIKPTTETK
jgi:outer membrane protein OmpA-like peptidoglycan-associated protein/tetratricopeptide (TPR) repeat protein